jgi:uncharacterized membrane protein HdeD (DUF308 family)
MLKGGSRDWRLSYGNGILAILFGSIAIIFPGITIIGLAFYFAVTIILGGVLLTVSSIRSRKTIPNWQLMLTEGIIGILIGLVILARPGTAAAFFIVVMGIWAMVIGLIFIISYFRLTLPAILKPFHILTGLLSVIIGIIIILNPFESTRIVVILIGIYVIAYGIFSIINARKGYSADRY